MGWILTPHYRAGSDILTLHYGAGFDTTLWILSGENLISVQVLMSRHGGMKTGIAPERGHIPSSGVFLAASEWGKFHHQGMWSDAYQCLR